MLEVKNLVKCYSTKGGVTVKALDDVSVKFPETGMVFLLGRSGSGKSTLLNVSGGLDKPDSGEVIVKGRSSKDFSSSDFDSYRNTFIGFIFQEYNILNEFTVEQNIALALQIQGKPNDKKAVAELLEQVDLAGFGKRKPNTLSGGQKQRVAIARALIKEPEIIMADEPTGALDSNTGKQVFDTLKKLSQTKLVIVVSHDRDFAEQYGDRIIELKDGQIISDVTKAFSDVKQISENVEIVSPDTISIKKAENITEADVKNIVKILKENGGEAIITASKRELPNVKRACKISESGNKEYFTDTTEVKTKEYDGNETKFIKSKLPAAHAIKMGASGLKTKPIRLIFAILLSVVSFVLFGVVSTFMLYDSNYSIAKALQESNYPSITISKKYDYIYQNWEINTDTDEQTLKREHESSSITRFGVNELQQKNANGVNNFAGIFTFQKDNVGNTFEFRYGNAPINVESGYYPVTNASGFTDCGQEYMNANGFYLIDGRYPQTATEIAIPEYLANLFVNTESFGFDSINSLVGEKVEIQGFNFSSDFKNNLEVEIVGIFNVGAIPSKYDKLKTENNDKDEVRELSASLEDYLTNSFNTIIYVTEDFYNEHKDKIRTNNGVNIQENYANGLRLESYPVNEEYQDWWSINFYTEKTPVYYAENIKFYDLDGVAKEFSIDQNQVWISKQTVENAKYGKVSNYAWELINNKNFDAVAREEITDNSYPHDDKYALQELVDTWYQKLALRRFAFDSAGELINYATNQGIAELDWSSEFATLYEKARKYVNATENETPPAMTEPEWDELVNTVRQNLKTIAPRTYYFYFGGRLNNNINETQRKQFSEMLEVDDFGTVINNLWSLSDSDEKYQLIKQIVDENYEQILGETLDITSDAFCEPSYAVNISEIYYKDYSGNSGALTVCGYFDTGNEWGPYYLIHSDFAKAHSISKDYNQNTIYKGKKVTSYVEPEDAKYNYLITRTDNSQGQIENILSSSGVVNYSITNNVYSELNNFLELITDMQKIFIIAGLVFGVFSALMLLNFISVSISAKKKDIGILRAVGARGMDVFKIFFSEAFIISIICIVISVVGAYFTCNILNSSLVDVVNIQLLNFNIVNVALIIAVALVISVVATFFPVYFTAKKAPVESIRAL